MDQTKTMKRINIFSCIDFNDSTDFKFINDLRKKNKGNFLNKYRNLNHINTISPNYSQGISSYLKFIFDKEINEFESMNKEDEKLQVLLKFSSSEFSNVITQMLNEEINKFFLFLIQILSKESIRIRVKNKKGSCK